MLKLNERQTRVLQYMSVYGTVTNRKYRELFFVSNKTANLELRDLVQKYLIRRKGLGRAVFYEFVKDIVQADVAALLAKLEEKEKALSVKEAKLNYRENNKISDGELIKQEIKTSNPSFKLPAVFAHRILVGNKSLKEDMETIINILSIKSNDAREKADKENNAVRRFSLIDQAREFEVIRSYIKTLISKLRLI